MPFLSKSAGSPTGGSRWRASVEGHTAFNSYEQQSAHQQRGYEHGYWEDSPYQRAGNPAKPENSNEKMKGKSVECKKKNKAGRCLSKHERELLLPNGFLLAVEPKVAFNLYDNEHMGRLRILVKTDIMYTPPANLVDASGRSLSSSKTLMDKQVIYNTFKSTVSRFGADGEACLQRAVCEVAEAPLRRDGLIGDILNMILSPSHRLEDADAAEVAGLLAAERRGREVGQCHLAYPSCPLSLFNAIDSASDYTGSILDALADHGDEAVVS
ncbi:uncharacterized protein LOC119092234 [Pollicipes pollicipes]|uniref:uncharacterized protein LOC119092234 n=1 Tax=Pollicipes pollicipes TaxID=41117 RepID=UPI00188596D3|nr:uncharacterized protein LOC119092234 [Pollicipes pollicipes]